MNQNDILEMIIQVTFIGDVYKGAAKCVARTGESIPLIDRIK